jgi:hypothetical protein
MMGNYGLQLITRMRSNEETGNINVLLGIKILEIPLLQWHSK